MKTFIHIILCFLIFNIVSAQQISEKKIKRCGAKEHFIQEMKNAKFKKAHLLQQKEIAKRIELSSKLKSVPCANPVIIPVAVHYNDGVSNANPSCLIEAAQAQIAVMNEDFGGYNEDIALFCHFSSACPTQYDASSLAGNGTCIQFCLADQNLPSGEDNIGGYAITVGDYKWTGGVDAPNWAGYLNIFVYEDAAMSGLLGIAPYGGGFNPNGNGVFIGYRYFGGKNMPDGCFSGGKIGGSAPYNLGRTGTHEVGHYFALDHVFDDYNYTGQCGASDFFDPAVDDTPDQNVANYGVPFINYSDCSSSSQNSCGTSDYFFNFMDYVDDIAMLMFTEAQATVMKATAEPQAKWATSSVSCYNDFQNGSLSYEPIFENGCINNCFDVSYTGDDGFKLKIWLEGFDNGSVLNNALSTNNIIPQLQPFNYPPFNYNGSEYVYGFGTSIVDWVFIEVFDTNDDLVAERAAILTTSGRIIDIDGGEDIHFPCLTNGAEYQIVVYHKSHLGVVSSTSITYPASVQYDFTTGVEQAKGNEQLKEVNGKFCLYAGDMNSSGIINNQDYNKWALANALVNNYVSWDVDGNGIVNNLDYNLWQLNRAKVGEPLIQK